MLYPLSYEGGGRQHELISMPNLAGVIDARTGRAIRSTASGRVTAE